MGAFLVRGKLEEVRQSIRRHLAEQGLAVFDEPKLSGREPLTAAQFRGRGHGTDARIRIEPHGKASLVNASFHLGLARRLALHVPCAYVAAVGAMIALHLDEFATAITQTFAYVAAAVIALPVLARSQAAFPEFPRCYLLPTIAFLLLLPAWRVLATQERAGKKALADLEASFWAGIKKDLPTRMLALAKPRLLPTAFAVGYTTVFCGALGVLLYSVHPWALALTSPFLAVLWMGFLTPFLWGHRPGLYGRSLAVAAGARMTVLDSLLLWLLAFCLMATGARSLGRELREAERNISVADLNQFLDRNGMPADEVRSGAERLRQITNDVEYGVQKLNRSAPWTNEWKDRIKGGVLAAFAVLLAVPLVLLALLGFHLFSHALLELPASWRMHSLQDQPDWIRLPAGVETKGVRNPFFRLTVLAMFLPGALLNTASSVAAIDVAWWAATGRALIFHQVEALLTWMCVPFLATGMLTGTADAAIWHALPRAVLLWITLPVLMIPCLRVVRGCLRLVISQGLGLLNPPRGLQIPRPVTLRILETCQRAGVTEPRVTVVPGRGVLLAVTPGLPGCKATIRMTTGALEMLTEPELAAAVAHEVGHIVQGMSTLCLLRVLSVLGGFPPWFLLLMVDLRKREEDADRFSLQSGASPDALARAIIKASAAAGESRTRLAAVLMRCRGHVPDRLLGLILKFSKSAIIINRFLFTDEFVGFAHPLPQDRIATVLQQAAPDPSRLEGRAQAGVVPQ